MTSHTLPPQESTDERAVSALSDTFVKMAEQLIQRSSFVDVAELLKQLAAAHELTCERLLARREAVLKQRINLNGANLHG